VKSEAVAGDVQNDAAVVRFNMNVSQSFQLRAGDIATFVSKHGRTRVFVNSDLSAKGHKV
jgi:hypothetical protein